MPKVKVVADTNVNLNSVITPFLDMAFQILGFFVMTYHPNALEGHIDGKLLPPEGVYANSKGGGAAKADNLPPAAEEAPEIEDHIKVLIRAVQEGQVEAGRQDGEPSQILIQRPQDPSPALLADIDLTFKDGMAKLKGELLGILDAPGGAHSKVKIMGDGNLKYLYVMEVYDLCRLAEVEKEKGKKTKFADVSFVGPAPLH